MALVAAALASLARAAPGRSGLFVALLAALPTFSLMLPDLLFGGRRSAIPRYWVPAWIAVELAVAAWLARGLRDPRRARALAGAAVLLALLGSGAASVVATAGLPTWWDTNPQALRGTLEAARILNTTARARVATAAPPYVLLVLVGELHDDVTILSAPDDLLPAPLLAAIDAGEPLYLYNPSPRLLGATRGRMPLTLCIDAAEVQLWCPAASASRVSSRDATAAGS
jgi:hypothetical protein